MILGPKIAPFLPADSSPPRTTWRFLRWALMGAWRGILWAAFWSGAAGSLSRKGKRWFCSEAEAVAAGWRPSATR